MGIQISLPMMAFLVLMTGFAGFVDSAAGGGGLISLPAYLFAGLPPHYTYATNKFSAACGTTFATASFFRNGAMNVKVGVLAAVGSFVGSALGAHIVLMLSDEVLQAMMFIILPIAAVVILWRRNLPDENRDDGTIDLKKTLLALGIGLGIPPLALIAMFPAVNGYFFLPNYPTMVAAINFDRTGSTGIGHFLIDHSFQLAGFITTVVSIGVGYLIIQFL